MKTTTLLHLTPTRALLRTTLALAAGTLCLSGLAAADTVIGSGHVVSETRQVSGFHGVKLTGSGDVIVTQGDTEGLVIEAEDNLLPLLESTVGANGILHLGFKDHVGSIESKKDVTYKLSVKTLDKVTLEGSGSLRADSLAADHPDFALPGSGEITVDHLKAEAVNVLIEGSGKVKLAGEAATQKVSLDGSGEYVAKNLKTASASVVVNGSGESEVWASESLKVEINGSGEVGYHGNPTVKKSINGSGEVNALGAKND